VATDGCQTFGLILWKLNWNSTCLCVNDAYSVAEISRRQWLQKNCFLVGCDAM